jgi:ketosteroid isomerase-like protein
LDPTQLLGEFTEVSQRGGIDPMFQKLILASGVILFSVTIPALAQESPLVTDEAYKKLQTDFAEAYNRKDTATMAAFFSENGIRITPNGIFRGREAIQRDMQKTIELGIHDYRVQRTVSRVEGNLIFNAGEWKAKIGDRQFRGYYSALVTREGGEVKILEETVNVAAAGQ